MKVAFFLEADSKNPGGYNQTLSSAILINKSIGKDTEVIYLSSSFDLKKQLLNKNIKSILYKKSFLNKIIDYILGLSFLFKSLIKFKIEHSFTKFLKKNKIDLIVFLSPSELSLFCGEINFVLNIWDLDHRKNSPFPEHREKFTFENREFFLKVVLLKAFKIIVPHNKNKEDLIKLYNCNENKIIIQTFIPYLSRILKDELRFSKNEEEKIIKNLPANKKMILYPATFWAHKNHKYIIDVAILLKKANINNYYFLMCGSDKGVFNYINKLIEENNISDLAITFPLISNFCLKTLYEKSFAIIMPTDAGPTNLPLYESMFFKKPIFYSKNILDEEIQKIILPIDPKDPNSFLRVLQNVKNEDLSKKIQLGSNYYKNYCSEGNLVNMYNNIINEFKSVLNQWKK